MSLHSPKENNNTQKMNTPGIIRSGLLLLSTSGCVGCVPPISHDVSVKVGDWYRQKDIILNDDFIQSTKPNSDDITAIIDLRFRPLYLKDRNYNPFTIGPNEEVCYGFTIEEDWRPSTYLCQTDIGRYEDHRYIFDQFDYEADKGEYYLDGNVFIILYEEKNNGEFDSFPKSDWAFFLMMTDEDGNQSYIPDSDGKIVFSYRN